MSDDRRSPVPAGPGARYVHALALGLDAGWRRLPDTERARSAEAFEAAVAADPRVATETYSLIGLKAGVDLLVWRLGPSVEALEEAAARTLRSGLGRWLTVRESFVGLIGESQYVAKPTSQEQSLFEGERARYLVVYPFTKSTEWYLLPREIRQGSMNEHMRIGHGYPQVRQLLAYSFGLDDQDFVVAYETDDLPAFSALVRELRATEGRRSTVRDTPILTGVHRSIHEILELLGAWGEPATETRPDVEVAAAPSDGGQGERTAEHRERSEANAPA
ncbi:MAG TPA: chlorite dismutase family protein [Candidatus Dormibacteraeota bacterium]|nr:chlorite dismutase family protein [Candidatus Dormibacteraeota bacterium]